MIDPSKKTSDRPEGEKDPTTGPRVRRRVRTGSTDRQRRKAFWKYGLLLLSAGLMVNAVIGEKGYLANVQAQQEFQDTSESLRALEAENARLKAEGIRLRTDPQALEDAARQQLGLIKPGETLITLRDRPASRD